MTTVTTPDLPDFTQGQAPVAVDVLLSSQTGLLVPRAVDVQDVGHFSTLILKFVTNNIAGVHPILVNINWIADGDTILTNTYAFSGGSNTTGVPGGGQLIIPTVGDAVEVSFDSDTSSTQSLDYFLYGSTRQTDTVQMVGQQQIGLDAIVARTSSPLAAGATVSFYLGPVAKGFYVDLFAAAVTTTLRVVVFSLNTGTWVGVRAGEMVGSATLEVSAEFHIPNVFVRLDVLNSAATASNVGLYVCELR